ncbi:MAG TPA: diacylglycerol kinase family protein [Candidatus Paceibacterota bacterium]|nr:diacylglycerol kinase family protein [Candidatus Paceibacterota bacterium]HPT18354.1 diacylglycerol kinase family protein [Candidatus Paceibacterota bacterium]
MNLLKEKKRFSIVARIKSVNNAWRGIVVLIKTTHNFWLQIFFAVCAVYLGFILHISKVEWLFVVFTIGLVFIAEAFNTAFEIDIDLTSPNFHPYARDTKDVSAGAVLLSIIVAIVVAMIIFLPKILLIYNIVI